MDKTEKAIFLDTAQPFNYNIRIENQELINSLILDLQRSLGKRIVKYNYQKITSTIIANLKINKMVFISLNKNNYNNKNFSFIALKRTLYYLQTQGYIKIYNGYQNKNKKKRTRLELLKPLYIKIKNEKIIVEKDLIILKNENKEEINIRKSKHIHNVETFLNKYNDFLSKQYISIGKEIISSGKLFRVFNQSSLKMGGRFFGGLFQTITKSQRKKLLINGNKTVEFDYASLHINILYHKHKLNLEKDAYEIKSFDRKTTKFAMMIILNANSRATAEKAINFKFKNKQINAKDLINKIEESHAAIKSEFYNPKIGSKLQYIESSIAFGIMQHFLNQQIIILPIHDGFIIEEEHGESLKKAMKLFYKKKMRKEINVLKA